MDQSGPQCNSISRGLDRSSHRLLFAAIKARAGQRLILFATGGSGMRYHRKVVLALVVCTAIGASSRNARAQFRSNNRYAQNTAPAGAAPAMSPPVVPPSAAPGTRGNAEELPMGRS